MPSSPTCTAMLPCPLRWALLAGLLPVLGAAAPRSDLRPELQELDEYTESFTFVADLADGTYVQLQLAVSNLGPGSGTGLCRALVARPGKKAWTASERVSRQAWRHTGHEDRERLQVGRCSIDAAGEVVTRVALEDGVVTLRLPGPLAPRVPPSGTLSVDDREHRTWLVVPFAKVAASLQLPGEPATELSGGAYADHSRSSVPAKSLARRWIRFRALQGEHRALLLAREGLDGGFEPAWLWLEGTEPQTFARFTLTRTGNEQAPTWSAALSGSVEGRIVSTTQLYRYAPLEELGALGALVAPVVGSPVTWTSRATLELKGRAPMAGIMEVSLHED